MYKLCLNNIILRGGGGVSQIKLEPKKLHKIDHIAFTTTTGVRNIRLLAAFPSQVPLNVGMPLTQLKL